MLRLIGFHNNPIVWKTCDDAIISHSDMPKLKIGDIVSCRVKSAAIVSPYRSYDEIKSFVIVAVDEHGYYLFVPHYYCLSGCFIVDQYRCKTLGMAKKYIDENVIYITSNFVSSVESQKEGLTCRTCRELFSFAEANQQDGSFICYSCRANPYR